MKFISNQALQKRAESQLLNELKGKEIEVDYDHIMGLLKKMKKQFQDTVDAKQRRNKNNPQSFELEYNKICQPPADKVAEK